MRIVNWECALTVKLPNRRKVLERGGKRSAKPLSNDIRPRKTEIPAHSTVIQSGVTATALQDASAESKSRGSLGRLRLTNENK